MDRNQAKVLLPIIQAYAEGKTIQVIDTTDQCGTWKDVSDFKINTDFKLYRIKSETTYRPFKNAEECWQEMQKHQPFGWVISIGVNQKINLKVIGDCCDLETNFKEFTFADGTPFGVKVEE